MYVSVPLILVYTVTSAPPKKNNMIQTLKISSPKICLMSFPQHHVNAPPDGLFERRTLPVTQPEASIMSISPVYGHGPPAAGERALLLRSEPLQKQMDVLQQRLSNNLIGGFAILLNLDHPPR